MRTLGNILWHIPFCGFLRSICYAIGGLFWCITIIGIPLGMGLFQLSLFALAPFTQGLVSRADLEILTGEKQNSFVKGWSLVIRILYFPFGLFLAIITIFTIVAEFLSLIGIPCGLVEAKALSTIFNPINKKCVPRAVAEEIERRKSNNSLNKYLKTTNAPTSATAAQVIERIGERNETSASEMSEYLRKAEAKTDDELKSILQNKGDYNPRLIKAAEKVLLDRVTAVSKPKDVIPESDTTAAELGIVTPVNDEDRNKAYQPSAYQPTQEKEEVQSPVKSKDDSFDVVQEARKPEVSEEPRSVTTAQPEEAVTLVATSSKANTTVLISILAGVLLAVGGALTYFLWYVPYARDRDAPRTYVVANSVFLRSSQMSGVEYNILGSIPYGSEVITYSKFGEWAEVKVNGQEGFIAAAYLLDSSDFNLLNGVWGDNDAKECIESSKCRLAILNYYKTNRLPSGTTGWQIYTRMKDQKPNTVFYPRIYNKNSKFTDFVFILKNVNEDGKRIVAGYSFEDETEAPIFRFGVWGPTDGYIQNILPVRDGINIVFDNGIRTKVNF